MFVTNPNGPEEEAVSLEVEPIHLRRRSEGSESNRGWVRCKGSTVMPLVFLRQKRLTISSRAGRGQPITFWVVLITFCTAFPFSAVVPA